MAFSDFLHKMEGGAVAQVTIAEGRNEFSQRDGSRHLTTPPGLVAGNPSFITDLSRRQVRIAVRPVPALDPYLLGPLLSGLLVIGLFALVYRGRTGGMAVSGGVAKVAQPGQGVIAFADMAGVDEATAEVKESWTSCATRRRTRPSAAASPRACSSSGRRAQDKTLLAHSIAGEAGVPFLFAGGADFVEMYAGVGAARVRRLFRDARGHRSCIVFIDELDCVGHRRGGNSLSNEEREQTLNRLLVEMDGFEARSGIVVIAATNRQDIPDPALLRPGRFGRQVMVAYPDLKGREDILRVHARKVQLTPQLELRSIARSTPGLSGAELANLMNEAALLAARTSRSPITATDIDAARDKVLMGVKRRSLAMTASERRGPAYHEAGHAVVAALLPHADPLHEVTIVPRSRALGLTMQLLETDRHMYSKRYLEMQVAILMGGRVAEELFLDQATTGAANDIEQAADIAQRMVCEFGMSSLGPLAFRRGGDGEGERVMVLSEEMARRVDEEVRVIVMAGYATVRELLERHTGAVHLLAEVLLEQESFDADEIRAVLARGGVPISQEA